jgi:hypothetical protein
MADPYEGPRLKLEWAKSHIRDFEGAIADFFGRGRCSPGTLFPIYSGSARPSLGLHDLPLRGYLGLMPKRQRFRKPRRSIDRE